jgi:hypothetical protein
MSAEQRPLVDLRPAPRLSEAPTYPGSVDGTYNPQSANPGQTPGAERASASNTASEPPRAKSVFADFGGSESAMDITKKVHWRYSVPTTASLSES